MKTDKIDKSLCFPFVVKYNHYVTAQPAIKQSILDLTLPELETWLAGIGERSFRARQIYHWLYQGLASDFASMANLPVALRHRLADLAHLDSVRLITAQVTKDRMTRKALLGLRDGSGVESVLMLYEPTITSPARRTVCVSSQAGCAVGCAFCATGRAGLTRSLTSGEIVGQVIYFARLLQETHGSDARPTNIVFMGQGEPMANFSAVWTAVEQLNSPYGLNLGARHITISTVGIVPQILALAERTLQVGLAVSLHAPDDVLRDSLVPINRRYPLAVLLEACQTYVARTGRRVTFEYSLLDGVNDSPAQAAQLADLLRGTLCHVNLIPFNTIEGSDFRSPARENVLAFQGVLQRRGLAATVRAERGGHIDAACGQLIGRTAG